MTVLVISHRNYSAICLQCNGMLISRNNRRAINTPQFETSFSRILISSNSSKRDGRFNIFSFGQQQFSICIGLCVSWLFLGSLCLYFLFRRIPVIAKRRKCRDCIVIISGSQQFLSLGIVHSRNDDVNNDQRKCNHSCCNARNNGYLLFGSLCLALAVGFGFPRFLRLFQPLRVLLFQFGFGFRQEFTVLRCDSGFFRILALLRIGVKLVQRLRDILRDRLGLAGSILCSTHQIFVGGKLLLCFLCTQRVIIRRYAISQVEIQCFSNLHGA